MRQSKTDDELRDMERLLRDASLRGGLESEHFPDQAASWRFEAMSFVSSQRKEWKEWLKHRKASLDEDK